MSIAVVVGTRPEIIKMAPVVKELERRDIHFALIHTGQHYDYQMSKVFIDELELPKPHDSFILENKNPLDIYFSKVKEIEQKILEEIKFDNYALATIS